MSDEQQTVPQDDGFEDVYGDEADAPPVDEYRLSTHPRVVSGGA